MGLWFRFEVQILWLTKLSLLFEVMHGWWFCCSWFGVNEVLLSLDFVLWYTCLYNVNMGILLFKLLVYFPCKFRLFLSCSVIGTPGSVRCMLGRKIERMGCCGPKVGVGQNESLLYWVGQRKWVNQRRFAVVGGVYTRWIEQDEDILILWESFERLKGSSMPRIFSCFLVFPFVHSEFNQVRG